MDVLLAMSDWLKASLAAGQWCYDSPPWAGIQLGNSQEIKFSYFSGHRQEVGGKPGKSR